MKKTLIITSFALAIAGMTGATFAKSKSKSKSSKSSGSSSSSNKTTHSTSNDSKPDSSKKQTANTDKDKDNKMHKNTKMYRCRLPDGSTNPHASQELCLKVGGKWVKY